MIDDHLCGCAVLRSGRWPWLSFTICESSMLITGVLEAQMVFLRFPRECYTPQLEPHSWAMAGGFSRLEVERRLLRGIFSSAAGVARPSSGSGPEPYECGPGRTNVRAF